MKIFNFFFFLTLGFLVNAQTLTISPPTMERAISESDSIDMRFDITNTGQTNLNIYWRLRKRDWNGAWESQVCDFNLCYNYNIDKSGSNAANANKLGPGETKPFMIKIKPHSMVDTARIWLELFSNAAQTNFLIRTDSMAHFIANSVVSTNDEVSTFNTEVFPNPGTSLLILKEDANISAIEIVDLNGRILAKLNHTPGQNHDVSLIPTGVYFLNLADKSSKKVKTVRWSKI